MVLRRGRACILFGCLWLACSVLGKRAETEKSRGKRARKESVMEKMRIKGRNSDRDEERRVGKLPEPIFVLDPEKYKEITGVRTVGRKKPSEKEDREVEDREVKQNRKKQIPRKKARVIEAEEEAEEETEDESDKKTAKKTDKTAEKANAAEKEEENIPEKQAPSIFSSQLVKGFLIATAVVLFAGVVVLGLGYAVSRMMAERARKLRYMESLKPAYIKRGDGLDEYREILT